MEGMSGLSGGEVPSSRTASRGNLSHAVVYRSRLPAVCRYLLHHHPRRNKAMDRYRPRMDVTKALQTLNFSSSTKLSDLSTHTLQQKFAIKMDQVQSNHR